jgi:ketosteroid isomerase-like protein
MSDESPTSAAGRNAELAHEAVEAFDRRDAEAFIRYVSPNGEWRPFLTAGVEGGVYRGHDGIREWFATLDEMFDDISAELTDVRDLGDRVVMLGTLRGRGRGSRVPVESPLGIVVDLDEDGLMRVGIAFPRHADALAHAGVRART